MTRNFRILHFAAATPSSYREFTRLRQFPNTAFRLTIHAALALRPLASQDSYWIGEDQATPAELIGRSVVRLRLALLEWQGVQVP